MAAAFAASPARADELTWLAPERAASRTFAVGLTQVDERGVCRLPPREVVPSVAGGTLRELAAVGPVRTFAVEPAAREVTLDAELAGTHAVARIAVGPTSASVRLSANPARPVKGHDGKVELRIEILRADGEPDPDTPTPIVVSNVGAVDHVEPRGPGRFSARFHLPTERRPEVAIVVAFAPWPHADAPEGAFGALSIPLASAVDLPGRTEPGASIRVEIAGEHFGPVTANGAGAFMVPVVVPPGHRMATTIVSDAAGNQRRQEIDLQLPPTDQLSCVANPLAVPVGGTTPARVICAAFDPFGSPADDAVLVGRAAQGHLTGPRPLGGGLFEWTYAPPVRGPGRDRLRFTYPQGGPQSVDEIDLDLLPLPPAHVELQVAPEPVLLGSSATATLRAVDAFGRPVATRPFLAAERGALAPFAPAGDALVARYRPPDELGDWHDRIVGQVLAVEGRVPARIRAAPDAAWLRARVETLAENPVEGVELASETGRARSDRDGRVALPLPAPSGRLQAADIWVADRPAVRTRLWRVPTADGAAWFPAVAPPPAIAVEAPVALGPATPVDVQLEIVAAEGSRPGAIRFRVVDPHGALLPGRDVAWRIQANGEPVSGTARLLPDGSTEIALPRGTSGRVRATVIDRATGVSAAQEAVLP